MVCLDTPTSRATSSTFRPDSTCFTATMICASVCALLLIRFLLSFVRLSDARCADYWEQVTKASRVYSRTLSKTLADGQPIADGIYKAQRDCDDARTEYD